MYALTYPICLFLAALILAVLKLCGVIPLGWLWLYLSFFLVGSLGIIPVILWLKERRHAWQPREMGNK